MLFSISALTTADAEQCCCSKDDDSPLLVAHIVGVVSALTVNICNSSKRWESATVAAGIRGRATHNAKWNIDNLARSACTG